MIPKVCLTKTQVVRACGRELLVIILYISHDHIILYHMILRVFTETQVVRGIIILNLFYV